MWSEAQSSWSFLGEETIEKTIVEISVNFIFLLYLEFSFPFSRPYFKCNGQFYSPNVLPKALDGQSQTVSQNGRIYGS